MITKPTPSGEPGEGQITFADGEGLTDDEGEVIVRTGVVEGDPITAGGITVVATIPQGGNGLWVNLVNILTAEPPAAGRAGSVKPA